MKNRDMCGRERRSKPSSSASRSLAGAVSAAALLSAGAVTAQGSGEIEEIVVTGSLITRSGYEAPTPVSALDEEAFDQMPVTQIGELVERLPVFQGSQNSRNNVSVSDGTSGTNLLDLRGLGPNRTLILLDGKRVVGASIGGTRGGAVDVSNLPSGLVKRVEVITGGASATYGADALAGVVNFMLDKDYTGFKTRLQGSRTTHGDGDAYQVGFTGGIPFANERGHFLFDVEHGYDKGIEGKPRDWADKMSAIVPNPAYASDNTQPFYTVIDQAGLSNVTRGGLIVGCDVSPCPIRGTQFVEGGRPMPFEFGSPVSGVWMSGGDWETSTIHKETGLAMEQERNSVFLRSSYELTESTSVYGEFLWSDSQSVNPATALPFRLGNITIHSGNPFIPAEVQAEMDANGITQFTMGSVNGDAGNQQFTSRREMTRFVLGAEGTFELSGDLWNWEASVLTNRNDVRQTTPNNLNNVNYNKAVDVVLDGSGNPVCRINVDADPTNDDPSCVPYNPMGLGVLSPEAHRYAFATGWMDMRIEQEMVSGSVTGEPFENWAGPVSVAFGASYRTEEVSGASSELDQQAVFTGGNYNPTFGKYDVTEYYAETVVPLLIDKPFARQLDLNAAYRWTDYSTSGDVKTWKLGLSWQPHDDFRVRATRSRDIRAPSLGDLFDAGTSGTGTIRDPVLNHEYQVVSQTRGNLNIQPEIGDTTGIGFVYQPSWLPDFAMSLDWYDIEVEGAILSIGGQTVVDRCFEGNAALCDSVLRDPVTNEITMVVTQPQNVLSQRASGYDLEMSYRYSLADFNSNWEGDLRFRTMLTYVDTMETKDGLIVADGVGKLGPSIGAPSYGLVSAELRYLAALTYSRGPLDVTFTARGMGSGVYDNRYIECAPGSCPVSTAERPTINENDIKSITYYDLGFNYAIENGKVFLNFQNVFDTDPPHVASTSFWSGPGNMTFYERLGRIVRVGINYNF